MTKRQAAAPIVHEGVAGCLAGASRTRLSDTQVEVLIKARLKAEDAATMQRPAKVDPRPE